MKKKIIIISSITIIALAIIATIIIINVKKPVYEVYFETLGGSKIDIQYIKENKTAVKPENPTKVGFIFKGWFYKR